MYIVINSTKRTSKIVTGSFPIDEIELMLNNGENLIIISLYSNTIKVPYHDGEWDYYEYQLPKGVEIKLNPDIRC